MFRSLIFAVGLLAAQGALAQETLKVQVKMNRIVIDNTNGTGDFDVSTVCVVESTIKFQDVRNSAVNNGSPDLLPHKCSFEYLGSTPTLSLWAGAGAFVERNQDGVASDRFAIQGVLKIGEETSTVWGTSKVNDLDGKELTVDTPQRNADAAGLRKESFRVTYKFYK